jgi:hypothetical protein
VDPFLRFREALTLLLQAHEYAQGLHRSPWDFALELEALRETGLNHNDCRWLVYQNYVLHAGAAGLPLDTDGQVDTKDRLVLSTASCFILTPRGVSQARAVLGQELPASVLGAPSALETDRPAAVAGPRWDKDRRELWFGTALVKQFKVPAANQEIILAAFQEEAWPACLDDPLPPQPQLDPKRRLRDTVCSLNRNQKHFLIRFFGNGNGQGVRWEPASVHGRDSQAARVAD